jgi:hypothetical protein
LPFRQVIHVLPKGQAVFEQSKFAGLQIRFAAGRANAKFDKALLASQAAVLKNP